jgi:GT2 family glycosyltransferase
MIKRCVIASAAVLISYTHHFPEKVEFHVGLRATFRTEPANFQIPKSILRGVSLGQASGIENLDAPGEFNLINDDPQIILGLESSFHTSLVCVITFDAELVGVGSSRPRIYIDYSGKGFRQDCSFALTLQSDQTYKAIIGFPCLGPLIRWDPSERVGNLKLNSISVDLWNDPLAPGTTVRIPMPLSGVTEDERDSWANRAFEMSRALNQRQLNAGVEAELDYQQWVKLIEPLTLRRSLRQPELIASAQNEILFSFVIPTYNTPEHLLRACISALQAQSYTNLEICIADDNSTDVRVRATLSELAAADPRIKLFFRSENGHISAASNSALELASGKFIVLVDHDDVIPPYTLEVVRNYVVANPNGKIFYSDEDKLDLSGQRVDPYFKSNFNKFLMFGHNMVSHLGVYDRALIKTVGGFRKGYEGSQDYDLFLRCLGECSEKNVIHIPHVLYHWRMIPGSTSVSADQKSYAIIAARKALNDFMIQQKLPFKSVDGITAGISAIEVTDTVPETSVSIVIPTRDRLDLLTPCIESLKHEISDKVEIIIVDNGSIEAKTLGYFDNLRRQLHTKIVSAPGKFNFSSICNLGVKASKGDIVCLLNNDTELVSPQWLARARAFLSIPDVGIVGARLLYPDDTVQHFGLYLGMGAHGVAGTPHRGKPSSDFGPFGKARLVQEFSAVTAACMFVKRSVYDQVGGFDPDLRVAYNDVDFCLKVRALGFKVVCDPEIVLIHKESKSRGMDDNGARALRLEEEAALMRRRWRDVLAADTYYNPNLTLERDDFSLAAKPRTACIRPKAEDGEPLSP